MSNLPATTNGNGAIAPARTFNDEEIALITATVAPGLSPKELQLFLYQCERTGLDPLARQIYGIKLGGKLTIQTSIDGLRLIANRSGEYAGQTAPQWCGEDGEWKSVWLSNAPPAACRLGVYRKGFARPLVKVVTFRESAVQQSPMWKKMPSHMLAKVCEAAALRAAFPQELSGLYSQDEMGGDRHDAIEAETVEEPKRIDPPAKPKPALPPRPWSAEDAKAGILKTAEVLSRKGHNGPSTEDDHKKIGIACSNLGLGSDARPKIIRFVFGVESAKELAVCDCAAVVRWVGAEMNEAKEWVPNLDSVDEARAIIAAHDAAIGDVIGDGLDAMGQPIDAEAEATMSRLDAEGVR